MRPYEVMVIFDPATEPPAIQGAVDRIMEVIRTNEGVPGHVDRWGRRPFAYEVKHRREGYYVLVELSGSSQTVTELNRLLSLADEVLRHKVVRLPEKPVRRAPAPGPGRPSGRGGRPPTGAAGRPAGGAPAEARASEARGEPEPAAAEGHIAERDAAEREGVTTGDPAAG